MHVLIVYMSIFFTNSTVLTTRDAMI